MECPRCKSPRIQRGFKDTFILYRLAGQHELLCNNCGLEFRGSAVADKVKRSPSTDSESPNNRRRAPRYKAHLPAIINLVEKDRKTDKLIFSKVSRGHCETISKFGVALSFLGSRFEEADLAHIGRLLFVTITLPSGPIEAVVTTIIHDRVQKEGAKASWLVVANITQMNEADTARLTSYLDKRTEGERKPE
jgi:hypothetical protein